MAKKGYLEHASLLEGRVEIQVYKKDVLIDSIVEHNILLYQGLAEVIRTLVSEGPVTPRIVNRIVVGDQGTIPSDSTVPKVPTKDMTGLFHEVYRKDVETRTPTLYQPSGFAYTGNVTTGSNLITGLSSTAGITNGMVVTGTGIPVGTVVQNATYGPTTVQLSAAATSSNSGITATFIGTVNECQFVATFNAVDVPLTSFSNPGQPRLNEVGLVIINPNAGLVRADLAAPAVPQADEVVLSVRTFKSVPFEADNDISVVIRYTLFTE